jgi:hypothetical protein
VTDLTPLYRQMAADGENFFGLSIKQHEKTIRKLVRRTQAVTILDYGCGRGDAWGNGTKLYQDLGLKRKDITLYDPAFPAVARPIPAGRKFDGVLCSDVLEHIPEEHVEEFIDRLFGYARKFIWASVCCRLAKKTFPDGTNVHVTVKPYDWWLDRMHAANARLISPVEFCLTETP